MALEQNETDSRLSAPDWQDKYRWPDPVDGWSGALAGYPPDHPVRRGTKIELRLIARKYWADPKVTQYRQWITGWPDGDVTPNPVTQPETVTLNPIVVTKPEADPPISVTPRGRGRPKSGQAMTAAERKRASRANKEGKP